MTQTPQDTSQDWWNGYDVGFKDGHDDANHDWACRLEEEFDLEGLTPQNVVYKLLTWYAEQGSPPE